MSNYLFLAISIFFNILGNHLFKFASQNLHGSFLEKTFLIFAGSGILFYGLSAVLYILALRTIPLSIAYPMLSVTYVLTIFTSYFLFNEAITLNKLIGVVIILIGVFILSKNVPHAS